MRHILFRAWNETNKNFIYSGIPGIWSDGFNCGLVSPRNIAISQILPKAFVPEAQWEQFSGIPDKNERWIFENDIVIPRGAYSEKAFVVKWEKDGFHLPSSERYEDGRISTDFKIQYEVIGNIHENPDLIEEEK